MYSYQKSEPGTWTVGKLNPDGNWEPESDWNTSEEAAERAHWLNGGIDEKVDDDESKIPSGQQ